MHFVIIFFLLISAASLSVYFGKLTLIAGCCGFIIAVLLYAGLNLAGLALISGFFLMATVATQLHKEDKHKLDQKAFQSTRKAGQVLANGVIAGIFGGFAYLYPDKQSICLMAVAGAFSAATADTLSSEMGTIYGKRFYNILSMQPDIKGKDGVVSMEGTLSGLFGSVVIASLYCMFQGWSSDLFIIIASGFIGNVVDSILGATLERKHIIGNDTVNLLNTITGAFTAIILRGLLS